jgi:hypothetical protein
MNTTRTVNTSAWALRARGRPGPDGRNGRPVLQGPTRLDQGRAADAGAHDDGVDADQRTHPRGVAEAGRRHAAAARRAVGPVGQRRAIRDRLRPAFADLLGHAAPARQQLHRARAPGPAAGAALRARAGDGRPHLAAAGELRAAAHRAARGHGDRRPAPALRDHRSERRPRPRHRRLQGRLAGGRRAACGPPGVLRHVLPGARTGPDLARCLHRRGACS